jgi:hypothetical protein
MNRKRQDRNLIPSFSITQYIFNNLHIEGVERSSTQNIDILKSLKDQQKNRKRWIMDGCNSRVERKATPINPTMVDKNAQINNTN